MCRARAPALCRHCPAHDPVRPYIVPRAGGEKQKPTTGPRFRGGRACDPADFIFYHLIKNETCASVLPRHSFDQGREAPCRTAHSPPASRPRGWIARITRPISPICTRPWMITRHWWRRIAVISAMTRPVSRPVRPRSTFPCSSARSRPIRPRRRRKRSSTRTSWAACAPASARPRRSARRPACARPRKESRSRSGGCNAMPPTR